MQIELSKKELGMLISWYHDAVAVCRSTPDEGALYERILSAHREIEELESIDLNECTGGACTL